MAKDPTKPKSNDEKFKPKNVQNESHGTIKGTQRPDRQFDLDVSRGSGAQTKRTGR